MSYYNQYEEEIVPGDIVAVRHGSKGRQEGLVIGSHVDLHGRQVIEVQLEAEVYRVLYPQVTRVRRTISYSPRSGLSGPHKVRTVERRVLW